jgi:MinD superfamily P-loop ATPase
MIHAKLGTTLENWDKLVTVVRIQAKEFAQKQKLRYITMDGLPGTGCPQLSSGRLATGQNVCDH